MLILLDLAGLAFLFSIVMTPYIRDAARRLGMVDHPDQRRKLHAEPIPRVGGIVIALGYLVSFSFVLIAPYRNVGFNIPTVVPRALTLMPAAGLIFLIGLWDDLAGLRPWQKLVGQVVAAGLAMTAGVRINFLQWHELSFWLSIPITIVWLVGCANAFNLIDGLDGLAAGVGLFASLTTLVAALLHDNLHLALVTAPLVGCLLGFLIYNFNPASVFLGDSGSLLIGFLLGCYGIMWSQKSATFLGLTAPMMAMAIPLLDVALSVVRRFLRNQPIFGADRGHIHHRLLARGLTPRRAALCLYMICAAGAALSLLQDRAHSRVGGVIILLFCTGAWIGVQHLGYAEFGVARRMIVKGTLRSFIDLQLRIHEFERVLGQCSNIEDCRTAILAASQEFGFSAVRMNLAGLISERRYQPQPAIIWQMRVELPDAQYVNFYGDFQSAIHPGLLAGFAQTIERKLRNQIVVTPPEGSPPHIMPDTDSEPSLSAHA